MKPETILLKSEKNKREAKLWIPAAAKEARWRRGREKAMPSVWKLASSCVAEEERTPDESETPGRWRKHAAAFWPVSKRQSSRAGRPSGKGVYILTY